MKTTWNILWTLQASSPIYLSPKNAPSGTLFIHHAPNVTSDIRRDHYDFSTFGRRQSELCVYGIECIEGGIGSAGPDLGRLASRCPTVSLQGDINA